MKLHPYKSLQDEVFWRSAMLFISAGIAFGWMGAIFSSMPKSLEVTSQNTAPLNQPVAASVTPAPDATSPPRIPMAALSYAQVYWLEIRDNQIQMKSQMLSFTPHTSREERLTAALEVLLKPSKQSSFSSAIPTGTRLLHLQVNAKEVRIDLSREFAQGGGSNSMIYRVAQILYTGTCLEPESQMYLSVEGQLLDEAHPLGGEGLLLPAPLTRQKFVAEFNHS